MAIEAVGIIGSGPPAAELTVLSAEKGMQVRLYDVARAPLKLVMARIEWTLASAGKRELLAQIETVQKLETFSGADIVVEASLTSQERFLLFRKLEAVVSADCAICVRCVTENPGGVINEVSSSERFVGINFAEFIKASPVAEIARFEKTTDAVLDTVVGYSKRIGWEPLIGRHSPGMVINRIAAMYMLTGINMLEKGKGFVPEIDAAVREHMKVPMGPFELADYVGLDSFFNFNTYLYKALSQPDRFLPSKTVDRLSQYGETGRKCGIGFYIHDDGKLAGVNPRLPDIVKYLGLSGCSPRNIFADMAGAISAEAKLCAVDAQVSEYDVENAVRSALKWPKGPSSLAREAAIS